MCEVSVSVDAVVLLFACRSCIFGSLRGVPSMSSSLTAQLFGSAAPADAAPADDVFAAKANKVDAKALMRTVATAAAVAADGKRVPGTATVPEKKQPKHRSHLHDEPNIEENRRTVFVNNLPNDCDRKALKKFFIKCGEVESVRLRCIQLAEQKGDKNRGRAVKCLRGEVQKGDEFSATGYVLFKVPSAVPLALAMSGSVFMNRHLSITREDDESKAFVPKFSVFLGNLSYDIRDEEVWQYFLDRGITDVDRVRVIRDRNTGYARGIGYVGFRSSASVQRAIQTREQELRGRPLRICHVQKPTKTKLADNATRREKRRQKHLESIRAQLPEAPAAMPAGKKLSKKAAAAAAATDDGKAGRTSGRRADAKDAGLDEAPSWMGTTTNPRKKLPRDLRVLTQTNEDRKKLIKQKRKEQQERVREARKAKVGKKRAA